MYVRNYGMPPRKAGKDDEPVGLSIASLPSSEQGEEVEAVEAEKAELTRDTSLSDEGQVEKIKDNVETAFGANGIPRQPLRKRKRRAKSIVCGKSPQNEEAETAEASSVAREALVSSVEPQEQCAENEPCYTDATRGGEATARRCREASTPRKSFGVFSSEELFLGGLILLMINDRANDDILIILAFLLVSGIGSVN